MPKKSAELANEAKSFEYTTLLIIYINDWHRIMMHFNDTKKATSNGISDESTKERINKDFTDMISTIGGKLDLFLDRIVEIVFSEINSQLFYQMFS